MCEEILEAGCLGKMQVVDAGNIGVSSICFVSGWCFGQYIHREDASFVGRVMTDLQGGMGNFKDNIVVSRWKP